MGEKIYKFDIYVPGEYSAGIRGFTDAITVMVDSGDPGGIPGEFEEFIIEALAEWYDGGVVSPESILKKTQ